MERHEVPLNELGAATTFNPNSLRRSHPNRYFHSTRGAPAHPQEGLSEAIVSPLLSLAGLSYEHSIYIHRGTVINSGKDPHAFRVYVCILAYFI